MKLKNVKLGARVHLKAKSQLEKYEISRGKPSYWSSLYSGKVGTIVKIESGCDYRLPVKVHVEFDDGGTDYGDAESLKLLDKMKSPTGKEETVRLTQYDTPLRGDCKEGSKPYYKENLAKTLFFTILFIASFLLTGVVIDYLF